MTEHPRLTAIKGSFERLDYVLEWGDSSALLAETTTDLRATYTALTNVLALHEPHDAVMFSGSRQYLVKVCTGCGTDDGNWQRWPCPTVKAITDALDKEEG